MPEDRLAPARVINIVLGIWLFVSAFVWPHGDVQMTNTWIVGVLAVAFACVAMKVPEARYLNSVLAVWLFVSVWALPAMNVATMWNNALVALAIFVVSLAPAYLGGGRPASRL